MNRKTEPEVRKSAATVHTNLVVESERSAVVEVDSELVREATAEKLGRGSHLGGKRVLDVSAPADVGRMRGADGR